MRGLRQLGINFTIRCNTLDTVLFAAVLHLLHAQSGMVLIIALGPARLLQLHCVLILAGLLGHMSCLNLGSCCSSHLR